MLLQISTKDSLNSLSVSGGQPDNSMMLIIVGSVIEFSKICYHLMDMLKTQENIKQLLI